LRINQGQNHITGEGWVHDKGVEKGFPLWLGHNISHQKRLRLNQVLQKQPLMALDIILRQYGRQDILDDDGQTQLLVPRLFIKRQKTPIIHHLTQQIRQWPEKPLKNPPPLTNPPKNIQNHQGSHPTLWNHLWHIQLVPTSL
jgi:hypothetical protein